MATIDTVKEVLSENLDIDADQITEEATMEALGIDSLDMMELICDLEEKCEIEFGEPEAPFSAFRPNGVASRICAPREEGGLSERRRTAHRTARKARTT